MHMNVGLKWYCMIGAHYKSESHYCQYVVTDAAQHLCRYKYVTYMNISNWLYYLIDVSIKTC